MNKILRSKKIITIIVVMLLLYGCGTSPKDYQNTQPKFDLKEFFTGELKGWGLIKNYQGKVTKRFTVDMNGTWQGNKGELYELFKYQDGSTQVRIWHLVRGEDGVNTGTAEDVVGEASGKQQGFAFNWNYDLLYESDGSQIKVHLNDWLYLVDDNAVISESKIKKFGVDVGEVIVFMLKKDASS